MSEIGPSGVRALPFAAGRNEVGHYFFFSFLVGGTVVQNPEGVIVGFRNFAWAPK